MDVRGAHHHLSMSCPGLARTCALGLLFASYFANTRYCRIHWVYWFFPLCYKSSVCCSRWHTVRHTPAAQVWNLSVLRWCNSSLLKSFKTKCEYTLAYGRLLQSIYIGVVSRLQSPVGLDLFRGSRMTLPFSHFVVMRIRNFYWTVGFVQFAQSCVLEGSYTVRTSV